jgi:hypothetical protein
VVARPLDHMRWRRRRRPLPTSMVAALDERTARGHHLPFRAGFRRVLPSGREVAQWDPLTSTTMA